MRLSLTVLLCIILSCITHHDLFAQASFTAPDAVYVNDPVNVVNTSAGGSNYYWNFCSGGLYNPPQITNLGNIPGMDIPVFIATAKEGNDYYAFFTNNNTPSPHLIKLYFGNSLLNTPVATNLGSFGGVIPINTEGVQVVEDADGWHVLVVGAPLPDSRIVKVDFGASLSNNSPVAVNWGNIGNLEYPHDLYVTRENNQWYGFTVNAFNNTVTRFDFGTSFQNPPTGVNLGNLGNLDYPDGIFPVQENGNWYLFITNRTTNTLSRYDFGNSLQHTPTGVNLGNPDNVLDKPRDLCIIHDCGNIFGLVVNETNDLIRVDFAGGITGPLSGTSLGSGGGLSFPHSISTLFREDNNLYAFIVNASNNTLSRVEFNSCTNASIPSSTAQQPPAFSYNTPGTYTVNLIMDEGLPTQSSYCKNIVVTTPPVVPITPSFTAPDTVCVNEPVNVTNTTTGASTYYWNFCSGSLYSPPVVTHLGNPGSSLNVPTFLATAKDGNDYYAFVTNNTGSLVKYSFGNNLLNTPAVQDLGNMGGVIPNHTEGVQVVQDASGWHVLIVGGTQEIAPRIVKLDYGASLSNPSPVATNWGNLGNMDYPHDLFVINENNYWYGFTVNFSSNTVTRFDFGTSFDNPPVATNLGNLGNLDRPTGVFAIQENGNWYVFVTNQQSNTLTRLDFGNSMGNIPTGINLGNPDGVLAGPRDLCLIHDCGNIFGLVLDAGTQSMDRIDFQSDITSPLSGNAQGTGGFNFPHSISTVFREGNNLYAFIVNAHSNVLSRIEFNSCTNASIPSSTLPQPPAFSYSAPGTYTINLLVDESLPTQGAYCKTVVVLPPPVVNLGADTTVCDGTSVTLDAGAGFSSYNWSNGATSQQITVTQAGTYTVEVSNGGCTAQDDIQVNISQVMQLNTAISAIDCNHPTGSITLYASGGTLPYHYYLDGTGPATSNVFDNLAAGTYTVSVEDQLGCALSETVSVQVDPDRIITTTARLTIPSCSGLEDGAIEVQVQQGVPPFEYALQGQPFQASNVFSNLGAGSYVVYTRNGVCLDSLLLTLDAPAVLDLQLTKADELCSRSNGEVSAVIAGGTPPYAFYWNNTPAASPNFTGLAGGHYTLAIEDAQGCTTDTLITVENITPPPVTILNNDTTINIGETIQLVALNAPDYVWTPADGLSCTDCATPVAQPLQPTRYIVNTVTGLNCVAADTVNIFLSYDRALFVPNAFTPNQDGRNDLFRAKAKGVAIYNLRIFNRWGQLLFETADPAAGWNGMFKNELQPMGTYVYLIQYAYYGRETQPLQQKGTFMLIR